MNFHTKKVSATAMSALQSPVTSTTLGKAAPGVLAVVLLLLAGFSVWVAIATNDASDKVEIATYLSDQYQDARYALSTEESLERLYRIAPSPSVPAQHQVADAALLTALSNVRQRGQPDDLANIDDLLSQHEVYVAQASQIFAAVDAGDNATLSAIENGTGDPVFTRMEQLLSTSEELHGERAIQSLAEVDSLQNLVVITTPIVFVLGLGLLIFFWIVMRTYQRRINGANLREAQLELEHVKSAAQAQEAQQQSIRDSEERYRSLVQASPDAIMLSDFEGVIHFCNEEAATMFGYAHSDELLGTSSYKFIAPDEMEMFTDIGMDVVRLGRVHNIQQSLVRQDGSRFPVEFSMSAVSSAGIPVGLISVTRDITERIRAEEGLRAKEAAEQANRAKSEFLSRMSHELRTPLNAILGFGQLLQMEDITLEQQESIGYMVKGGEHLLSLINEVLDIARIEAGNGSFSIEPVLVRDVLQESLDLVHPLAVRQGISITVGAVLAIPNYIMADHQRLKQVFLNLLANAIKYNRVGGTVTVTVSNSELVREAAGADRSEEQGQEGTQASTIVHIAVRDTGFGLSPDKVARLFSPFDRLGAELGTIEGTGLGLALSKQLVEAMDGTIGVESVAGVGSIFWVDLPGTVVQLPEVDRLTTIPLLEVYLQAKEHASTVLYIEDNLSNFRLIEHILAKVPGINLISAMQGQIGLDMALEHMPDLILLDLHLPDMSGDDVLRRLKEDGETSLIPVLVLSADASPRRAVKLVEAGARDYLTKPLDVKHFLHVLEETLFQETNHRLESPQVEEITSVVSSSAYSA